jgi:peptidoglycan/xylan/chitin deacetylase (PgdA/CDA1 family)
MEPSVEALKYLILKLTNKKISGENFWPYNKKYAITLTHDVDTEKGFKNIPMLLKIEEKYNITSSWNIVGHSYKLEFKYIDNLVEQGHEIVLHGFNHDNKLAYIKNEDIELRFQKCLELLQRYNIKGFRSPSLLRSDRLFGILPKYFQYDSSIPDTEIYSPIGNRNGCCSVFPFFINNLLELPLTIPQDAVLLNLGYSPEKIFSAWINKLNWIKSIGALAVVNTHPDPHYSGNAKMSKLYEKFIETIVKDPNAWIANPCEIAKYWINNRNPRT